MKKIIAIGLVFLLGAGAGYAAASPYRLHISVTKTSERPVPSFDDFVKSQKDPYADIFKDDAKVPSGPSPSEAYKH